MIAITVFAIGVLAVLRLLTSNLVTVDKTETRTIATFLAKEWLDLVYNIRDANIQKGLPWDCLLSDDIAVDTSIWISQDPFALVQACRWHFASGFADAHALALGFSLSGYFFAQEFALSQHFAENFVRFALYALTGLDTSSVSWYAHAPTPIPSTAHVFARYIVFTGVSVWSERLPLQDVLKVESHVLFSKWASTWEIILESFIWKQ